MKDEDIIALAKEAMERAEIAEKDTRDEGLDDLRFGRLGIQWPEHVRKQRELEGRPCLTINKFPAFIRQVVNDARQNKPGIVVLPADSGADPDTAEVINGLIRNIQVVSDADVATDTAIESAVSNGFGYFRINISKADDGPDQDIAFERIPNPFAVYGDPDSTSVDGSDWNVCLVVESMTREKFASAYKGKDPVDWDAAGYTGLPAPWQDDGTILVAEFWRREEVENAAYVMSDGSLLAEADFEARRIELSMSGVVAVSVRKIKAHKVTQYLLTGAEVLDRVDWPGQFIPIIPVYGDEINIDGKRIFRSLVNQAKDSARMHNYWRTTSTELIALAPRAPYIGEEGAFDVDPGKWASANTESFAYLEYAKGKAAPMRQPFAGVPAGALQEALTAADDMKAIIGIHDASLGARSNETSGVAIKARQREGDVSTFHFIDNLSRAIRHAGRVIIDLIPKVYSASRIVRVLGEDMKPRSVRIESGADVGDAAREGVREIFDLSVGKYDLTVKAGPSYSTLREEARAEIVEIIRSVPESASILGPMYLRHSDWPGADDAADQLEQGAGMPPEAQEEMGALRGEIESLQKRASEIEAMKAEADYLRAKAELIRAEAETAFAGQAATEPQAVAFS